jgi:hypothetical protein
MRPSGFADKSASRPLMNRRGVLKAGAAGVLGWTLPQLLSLQASAASGRLPAARNVLVVLEQGGLSHIDTWDPKPSVPVEHRSPHRPIATSVPGIHYTELLAKTARWAHKLAVVRSMYHPRGGADGHPQGTKYILSGSHPSGAVDMPDIGSVASLRLGSACHYLPPYVMVPGNDEQAAETTNGFLAGSTRVFKTGGGDLSAPDWRVPDLVPPKDLAGRRLAARQTLLGEVESRGMLRQAGLDVGGMDRFYDQAFDTLNSPRVAEAFDVRNEPAAIRERYGPGHRGACYLVGRKLIEAGVRFVTVDVRWPLTKETPEGTNLNWDHHDFIYAKGTCNLPGAGGGGAGRYGIATWPMMGSTDQAFAALIEDLDQRGLLSETLVCFVTEFGRTPRLNKAQGRDHWPSAYSIVLAGAGVPGGQIIGATDKDGGYVTTDRHTPEDYAATLYEKLGIDRTKPLYTQNNRPVFLGHAGEPITGLF